MKLSKNLLHIINITVLTTLYWLYMQTGSMAFIWSALPFCVLGITDTLAYFHQELRTHKGRQQWAWDHYNGEPICTRCIHLKEQCPFAPTSACSSFDEGEDT